MEVNSVSGKRCVSLRGARVDVAGNALKPLSKLQIYSKSPYHRHITLENRAIPVSNV